MLARKPLCIFTHGGFVEVEETHGWQGEEGDPQEGETCGQHPARPRLWRLVPVADGGESDL